MRATVYKDNDNGSKKQRRAKMIMAICVAITAAYMLATIMNLWF